MKQYISNKEFLQEIKKFNTTQIISSRLHEMFFILSQRISRKKCWYARICSMNIRNIDIEDTKNELIHEGYYKCIEKIESFDIINKENPFSYFTTIVHNCFRDFFQVSHRQDELNSIAKNKFLTRFFTINGFKPTFKKEEKE